MNPGPVFRKAFLPWYDTNAACVIVLILMAAVMAFGLEGVRIARNIEQYQGYAWVPMLLVFFSGSIGVSVLFRMVKRYRDRFSF